MFPPPTPCPVLVYRCIGALFGMALRTKFALPLDLARTVWKQLLGDTLDELDLDSVDKLCVQACKGLRSLDAASFESHVVDTFVTRLSDGSEVELKAGGRSVAVTPENVSEFVELVLAARLNEGSAQVRGRAISVCCPVPSGPRLPTRPKPRP
jgi:hypothetical protein